jgi:hypothetical protein
MAKRKKWESLSSEEKIEELHREVTDICGAIQTIRLDLAHMLRKLPKTAPKK